MVYAMDSKSIGGNTVRVRVPLRPLQIDTEEQKAALAYIVGVALGDGNLSNPNGRAIRLRVSCDTRYPRIQQEIIENIKTILPRNAVFKVKTPRQCVDIVVYSNELGKWMPWTVGRGTKQAQKAHVPRWIFNTQSYTKQCLRGLLQTDGSIYRDRGYLMVNFTNNVLLLCKDVALMMDVLGFEPTFHTAKNSSGTTKYTIRLAKNSQGFIDTVGLQKA
jgi:DNA-binding transcriptional regulator WhiA